MDDSQQLLAAYVKNGSESAFRELVVRYINSVHSAALRLVNGDAHLAEDITQTVFVDLARKAHTFAPEIVLGGWLHRDTCFVAGKTMRGERRRQFRERQAVAMNIPEDHTAANLALVAPILDEAINQLEPEDRTAILLRFFEQLEFRAVGERMGSNEDAARMRVNRALDKLHVLLKNRGVAFSAVALGAALAVGFVSAAPLGLAATVAGTALASVAAGGVPAHLTKIMTMAKFKIAIVSLLAVATLAASMLTQRQSLAKLREENQSLQAQAVQLAALQTESERLSNLVVQLRDNPVQPEDNIRELARLRGEVALLRDRTNEIAKNLNDAKQNPGSGMRIIVSDKNFLRGVTMAEFALYEREMLFAPVTGQTGLTGEFDIVLRRSGGTRDEDIARTTDILRDDLGLKLVPYAGPFTEEEKSNWRRMPFAPTSRGYAIRFDHADAPGLKKGAEEKKSFGSFADSAIEVVTHRDATPKGALTLKSEGLPDNVANKLRMIDGAKVQWSLESRKQGNETPTWDDLRIYLGNGPNGNLDASMRAPEGTYFIGTVNQMPTFFSNEARFPH